MADAAPIFDQMATLAEETRARLLLALERHELSVGELCTVLQLPQSTVSRHLKVLSDAGWLGARRDGTSRHYALVQGRLPPTLARLWQVVRQELAESDAVRADAMRLRHVLIERRSRSREFFTSAAGRWDRLRRDLFGLASESPVLLGLLDSAWVVGDLGCGTGRAAEALAPFVARVCAVDPSEAMLLEAQRRLAELPNVSVKRGELEELPLANGELDAALVVLVLHHVAEPAAALSEVARVLKPGGRLLLVDLAPHERTEFRDEMGHLWLGFSAAQLAAWLMAAGFCSILSRPLPQDPQASAPTLLLTTAARLQLDPISTSPS